jgi:sRNA-binding carbon storage regulator CsrA
MGFKTTLNRGDRIELSIAGRSEVVIIDVNDIEVHQRNNREQVRINIEAPKDIGITKTKMPDINSI